MNVLTALIVLGFLILIHEAGHFLAATIQGIQVNGFSIGFGPALIKREIKGVTYAIRALPLGGFVSFPDDQEENNIPEDDPNLLKNRPIPQRAFVISAGVIANLLLAWIVLFSQGALLGLPSQPEPGVLVVAIESHQRAEQAGLQPGDRIIEINGINLGQGQEAVQVLVEKVKASPEGALLLKSIRGKERIEQKIVPTNVQGKGKIGAQLQPTITSKLIPAKNIGQILQEVNKQFFDLLSKTIRGYKGLFTEFGTTAKQLSGPVKIVEIGAQLTGQGSSGIILFTALISINLAVLNSLPLPLLDGGQLALLIYEAINGKPLPKQLQLAILQSGLVFMVGLSMILIIRDTSQLSIVQALFSN
ncbi:RIP metalloprotease RseP [Prochlorococcus sp. MIT 1341]|uniref:RIP metalloprotease RseP n=1 Tax=Prochlorococcus sp. MIT 1341 TaxID=3096221 RepID=UPI002A74F963|nr:RIP metalloprotease RseP [Prochlorococcus sp. MIT 1341]